MSSLLRFLPSAQKHPEASSQPEYIDAATEKSSIEKRKGEDASLKTTVVDASDQDPDLNPGTLTFEEGMIGYHIPCNNV